MATNKKSFIFYSDWVDTFKELPKDKGYDLLMHILAYVNDEDPKTEDFAISATFAQIKNTLKRDLNKWEDQRKQRSDAGKKSAEARKAKSNDRSTTVNDRQRKPTVSVSVSVSDSIKKIVLYLNSVLGSKYKCTTEATKKPILARINEGYVFDDFKNVIDVKYKEWNNTDMAKYLRPQTLFSNKFESYLNQCLSNKHTHVIIQYNGNAPKEFTIERWNEIKNKVDIESLIHGPEYITK